MSEQQTIDGTVPFSLLATALLAVSVGLLAGTFYIETPVYRFFCLGAFASTLAATILILAVTKAVIWPATIILKRGRWTAP